MNGEQKTSLSSHNSTTISTFQNAIKLLAASKIQLENQILTIQPFEISSCSSCYWLIINGRNFLWFVLVLLFVFTLIKTDAKVGRLAKLFF